MRRRGRFAELHAEIEAGRIGPQEIVNILCSENAVVVKVCPKCGRELPLRGAHFHTRACKG